MGLSWEEIEQAAAQKNENAGKFFEAGEAELKKWLKPVEDNRLNLTEQEVESEPSERIRRKTKYLLSAALENYEDAMQQDDDLAAIFEFAKQYADMQVTATYGDYKTEFDLSKKIYKGLKDYQDKLDIELMNEDEPGYSYYERQTVTANLLSYFENLRDGELIVPMDEKERKNAYFVDGVKHAPSSDFWKKDERQSDDAPLFSHAPNGNDVSQGALGDCYLLAPLSAIAETHPEIIRQSMVDHGDGTVTVRFYTRDKYDNFTPVYVTVEKVVPQNMHGNDAFAHDSMWVQTYERAWAASGLQQSRSDGVYGRPVPENIDEIYNRLLEKKKNKTRKAELKRFNL